MDIGGLQPISLIDYPGKMAAIVFTQGCGFRCPYCHNASLVLPELFQKKIPIEEIFSFLKKRQDKLEALVITGGEPTLQKDLLSFIQEVKKLRFAVKLDTSGICPDVLAEGLQRGLFDYVAMDIKTSLEKYSQVVGRTIDREGIERSIELLMKSSIPYEFRTTLVPGLHQQEDLLAIGHKIRGARLYVLQNFEPRKMLLQSDFQRKKSFAPQELEDFKNLVKDFVQECKIR